MRFFLDWCLEHRQMLGWETLPLLLLLLLGSCMRWSSGLVFCFGGWRCRSGGRNASWMAVPQWWRNASWAASGFMEANDGDGGGSGRGSGGVGGWEGCWRRDQKMGQFLKFEKIKNMKIIKILLKYPSLWSLTLEAALEQIKTSKIVQIPMHEFHSHLTAFSTYPNVEFQFHVQKQVTFF